MPPDHVAGDVDERPGLVVASYGRRVVVEDPAGERHRCLIRGRRLRAVCGDRVTWTAHSEGNVVVDVGARDNALARPDRRGREEVLAANVDQLIVVLAPRPTPDPFMSDRYLAAAELMPDNAAIVFNKTDLETDLDLTWLGVYESLGYPLLRVSAHTGAGIDALAHQCATGTSILVGLSGVGKSSLLNALVPDLELRTAQVSTGSGEGRHTTTSSVMHTLPGGGRVIDSPGVRDYAPPLIGLRDVAGGYREINARQGECRFNDCLHFAEPGCAVRAAVEDGAIDERRYASYRRLLNLMRRLGEAR